MSRVTIQVTVNDDTEVRHSTIDSPYESQPFGQAVVTVAGLTVYGYHPAGLRRLASALNAAAEELDDRYAAKVDEAAEELRQATVADCQSRAYAKALTEDIKAVASPNGGAS
jgi:hypothetical protein